MVIAAVLSYSDDQNKSMNLFGRSFNSLLERAKTYFDKELGQ